MSSTKNSLTDLVAVLRTSYGEPPRPAPIDPFQMVLLENVAYLVDDEVRARAFARLRKLIGITPRALLAASDAALVDALAGGGMMAPHRAQKLKRSAELVQEMGAARLRRAVRDDPAAAKKLLKRFPGFGDPGAERVLLFNGSWRGLAPDSNALRVLVRLGHGEDSGSYSRTYRSVSAAVEPLLPDDSRWLVTAHQLLRLHGRALCKNTTPNCHACPVSQSCPSAG